MKKIQVEQLKKIISAIFEKAGSSGVEAETISKHLVEANLVGHDSHGAIRVPQYIGWLREGKVFVNKKIIIDRQTESLAVFDGQFGFGQVIGEQAVHLGIEMAKKQGMAMVGLRNAGHLGRIGDWALQAADAGFISIHFVNSNGFSILVAPFGGSDRRLGSNPITISIPKKNGRHLLIDMATAKMAEGKIRVAKNSGHQLPPDTIIDGLGKATCDPNKFYSEPRGAILPLSPGHKGFGLSVMCEVLAGALTGGGTTRPDNPNASKFANGMFSIYIDPDRFCENANFLKEIDLFVDWVTASPKSEDGTGVLMPGEPEYNTKEQRLLDGIPLDEETVKQICDTARLVGLTDEQIGQFN